MGFQTTENAAEPPPGLWQQLQTMARSRGGMFLLGWTGGVLLVMVLYAALHPSKAQFSFPPRTIIKGNSLYERLLAAGKKSPIIMAGVNDGVASSGRVESRAGAARSAAIDLTVGQLPSLSVDEITVKTGEVSVQGVDVHYAVALPEAPPADGLTFLLLHGSRFSSATWQEMKTLRTLAALGYTAVAIDLPGAGFSKSRSRGSLPADASRAGFLAAVRSALGLSGRTVLVSPSLSGEFSLPLLAEQPGWLAGFVPVAPVGTEKLSAEQLRAIRVPTAIVYGSEDRGLGAASQRALSAIPTSTVAVIPGGGHPAYLHDPALWHRVLHNFAQSLAQLAAQY
ncbi:protein ABHD14B-like [Pollicipes pollicipes]|uniref:protein ABHD14B-like n=1 Tax=Pollicipes pollicipes TaxID=41117 RepID=UPI001884D584|nr:protein ABHD14B-like [Pollicipes pollicipes]